MSSTTKRLLVYSALVIPGSWAWLRLGLALANRLIMGVPYPAWFVAGFAWAAIWFLLAALLWAFIDRWLWL